MSSTIELVKRIQETAYELKDISKYIENRVLGEQMNEEATEGIPQDGSRQGGMKQELEKTKQVLEQTLRIMNVLVAEIDPNGIEMDASTIRAGAVPHGHIRGDY